MLKVKGYFKKSIFLQLFLVFYIGGLIFFFTSKLWLPDQENSVAATPIGTIYTFEDRDITLERWEYSETQNLMEVELEMLNHSTDGVKSLYYYAIDPNLNELPLQVIYEENNLIVLQISGLSEDWRAVSLRIKLTADDTEELRFYTNSDSVEHVAEIEQLSELEYYIQREEHNIDSYNQSISQYTDEINEYLEKIDNANTNINNMVENKKYQTEEEQLQTDEAIRQLENDIVSYQDNVAQLDSSIQDLESKVKQSQSLIDTYKSQMSE